jgi:hypothetical protein
VYIIISLVSPVTISRDLCRQLHILPWEGNEIMAGAGAKSSFSGDFRPKTPRTSCDLTRKAVESLMEPLTHDQAYIEVKHSDCHILSSAPIVVVEAKRVCFGSMYRENQPDSPKGLISKALEQVSRLTLCRVKVQYIDTNDLSGFSQSFGHGVAKWRFRQRSNWDTPSNMSILDDF